MGTRYDQTFTKVDIDIQIANKHNICPADKGDFCKNIMNNFMPTNLATENK